MDNIEELLIRNKKMLDGLEAPPEMETALRNALAGRVPARRTSWARLSKWLAAAALLLVMLTAYSFDAAAYYGRQLLGYDQVISDSLRDVNRLGMGQDLGKSFTFSDGTIITIDKIFFDENEFTALYTEKTAGSETMTSPGYDRVRLELKGLLKTYFPHGGSGRSSEGGNLVSWAMSFEPPSLLEKWMNFSVSKVIGGRQETGRISFTLDRDRAIMHSVKQEINRTIEVAGRRVAFQGLTVTPMTTVVTGKADHLGIDEHLNFDLMVDGQRVSPQGGGQSGTGLEWKFDGISKVHTLQLANIRIEKMKMVDMTRPLQQDSGEVTVGEGEDHFVVKKVTVKEGRTYLEIEKMDNVQAALALFDGDRQLPAAGDTDIKPVPPYPAPPYRVIKETRVFEGTGPDLNIRVKALTRYVPFDGTVDIPIK